MGGWGLCRFLLAEVLGEDFEESGEPLGVCRPCRTGDEVAVCGGAGDGEGDEDATGEFDVGLAGWVGVELLAFDDSGGGE